MSPHQSGRALDIHVGEKEIRLGASQARDGAKGVRELWVPLAYAWLVQNAGRFGFRPYLFEGHYHHWEYNPPK